MLRVFFFTFNVYFWLLVKNLVALTVQNYIWILNSHSFIGVSGIFVSAMLVLIL